MAEPFDFPLVVADIGGTNARFAIIEAPGAPLRRLEPLRTRDHAGPAEALAAGVLPHVSPRSLVMAVAGPIGRERTQLTNAPWLIEPAALIKKFSLSSVLLLNDFEALALALPELAADDLLPLGGPPPAASGRRLVLGPGTGLGAAALIEVEGRVLPLSTEAGHVTLAPQDDTDRAIWPHLADHFGRVDAERIISGPGLVALAGALAAVAGTPSPFAVPADITRGATEGDAAAAAVAARFCRYLGRAAGDLALAFLPATVFVTGGVARRLAEPLASGGFRAEFEAKPPYEALLGGVSTVLIRSREPALAGLAALAADPSRFMIDLAGRVRRP